MRNVIRSRFFVSSEDAGRRVRPAAPVMASCLIGGLILLIGIACAGPDETPRAIDGRMDLMDWDPSEGNVDLRGQWSVCWGQLLSPGAQCPSEWSTVGVRGIWSNESAASPFGGKGVATYRLRIVLPSDQISEFSLSAGAPMTAYRLWINGEERGGAGVVGRDASTTSSEPRRNRVFSLPRGEQEVDLWVQIANFEFRGGGIRRPWVIGQVDAVQRLVGSATVLDALLATIILSVGFASLMQFALRRSDLSRGYFGLFAIVMAVRMIPGSISDFAQLIVPWASFSQLMRSEYLGSALGIVFGLGYLANKFPELLPPRTVSGIQLASLAVVPILILAPFALVLETLPFFLVMPAFSVILVIIVCGRAWWRGSSEVRVTFFASLVFAAGVIHDAVRASVTTFGFAIELFPYFVVVWLFVEFFELAKGFANSFRREELLAGELADLNVELRETEAAVARFVPFDLLTLLGKHSIREVEAGDYVRVVLSVLHCDVRSFGDAAEQEPSEEGVRFVNHIVARIVPLIEHSGGFVSEHRGEGLQGLFPNGADAATGAALEILEALRASSGQPVEVGIGIDTGPLLIGATGEEMDLIGSAIGRAVSRAERLALATRGREARLLVSGATRDGWQATWRHTVCEFASGVERAGDEGDDIYEVLGADDDSGGD